MNYDTVFPAIGTLGVPITDFLVNSLAVVGLSMLLQQLFVAAGRTAGDRSEFARLFTPIAFTTFFIITVIRSSLTLALGLVGALSIVRFRTAIREPEELAYLFIAIAIGIGLGADYFLLTCLAVALLAAYLGWSVRKVRLQTNRDTMHFRVEGWFKVEDIQRSAEGLVQGFQLVRVDESKSASLVLFAGKIALQDIDKLVQHIKRIDPEAAISVNRQI